MKIHFFLLIFQWALLVNDLISQEITDPKGNSKQSSDLPRSKKNNSSINSLTVFRCKDFTITGKGNDPEWDKAKWTNLTKLDTGGRNYESKFKILYSTTGIYVLFSGEDDKITTKAYNDFEAIYNGDVFEVFLHPIPKTAVYFEYEINQLNKELILTLSKVNNQLYSWAPRYPALEDRKPIKKMVDVAGEKIEVGSSIKTWSAEIFFPYTILGLLPDIPPVSGTIWNANFCRLDYDSGNMIKYSWSPAIQRSFHELDKFQSIKFE
jgi:hypothetical protein